MSGRYGQDTLFIFLKTPNHTLNVLETWQYCRYISLFGSQSRMGEILALLLRHQEGIRDHFAVLHSKNILPGESTESAKTSVLKFLQDHDFRGLLVNAIYARYLQQNGVLQGSTLSMSLLAVALHAIRKAAVHLSHLHRVLATSPTTTFPKTLRQSNTGSMSL
jgi:hypothetical protein